MIIKTFLAHDAPVIGYLHDDHDRLVAHKTRPAVVICPGGAYRWLSPREGEPVALQFFAEGYQTFVLQYTVGEGASELCPLRQLGEALRQIRQNAESLRIQPEHIAVLGFSAGGHLAGSLACLWQSVLWSTAGFALAELGMSPAIPLCSSLTARSRRAEPSAGISLISTIGFFGILCSPALTGFLAECFGLRSALLPLAAMGTDIIALAPLLPKAEASQ